MIEIAKQMEQTIALAGLLHDIGKFMQRANVNVKKENFESNKKIFCPHNGNYYNYLHSAYTASFFEEYLNFNVVNKDVLRYAANHHKTNDENEKIIMIADRLSSGMERLSEDEDENYAKMNEYYKKIWGKDKIKNAYKKIRLQSGFDTIELKDEMKEINKIELKSIDYENLENLFPKKINEISNPKEGEMLENEYKKLWDDFIEEIKELEFINNFNNFYNQIYYLLQKYTISIASSTIDYPDISLFDHLRTTSAIGSVLLKDENFLLIEGDLSGIQNFIFKITEGEDKAGVSKKLRGRSFYISMLTEIISRYIIEIFDLTIANILYCGGGKFQILLPANLKEKILNLEYEINEWLLEKYDGLISCIFAFSIISKSDIKDYGEIIYDLSRKVDDAKKRKMISIIKKEENFFIKESEKNKKINLCKSCGLKIYENNENECSLCKEHKNIGLALTKLNFIIFSNKKLNLENEIDFGKFGKVYLIENLSEKDKKDFLNSEYIRDIVKVNSTDKKDKIKGFKFIANIIPKAKVDISDIFEDKIHKNSPLTFEAIANLSIGDKKIGILKMDIDNLGMIFSFGLSEEIKSISRIASISRNIDMFFGGYLNKICEKIYREWEEDLEKKENENLDIKIAKKLKEKINQIFYITYAGGDDLFIVGPWEYTIKLSKEIRNELKRFTGNNPNIDISAGIALIKPKFPIFKGAESAEEMLSLSKKTGKKRLTVFNSSILWESDEKNKNLEELLNKIDYLIKLKEINKSLIYSIYELNKKYYKYSKEKNEMVLNIEYFPKLIYKLTRNIDNKEIIEKILEDLRPDNYFEYFKFIGSYILEKTRGGNL